LNSIQKLKLAKSYEPHRIRITESQNPSQTSTLVYSSYTHL